MFPQYGKESWCLRTFFAWHELHTGRNRRNSCPVREPEHAAFDFYYDHQWNWWQSDTWVSGYHGYVWAGFMTYRGMSLRGCQCTYYHGVHIDSGDLLGTYDYSSSISSWPIVTTWRSAIVAAVSPGSNIFHHWIIDMLPGQSNPRYEWFLTRVY